MREMHTICRKFPKKNDDKGRQTINNYKQNNPICQKDVITK